MAGRQISVVVTTYDRPDLLAVQLRALAAQKYDGPWEVVLVDNGPNAGTPAVADEVAAILPRFQYVKEGEGNGPAFSRNVGARATTGEWIAFLDEDDEVADGWLAAIAAALEDHPVVAAHVDVDALNPHWLVVARGRPQPNRLPTLAGTPYDFAAAGTMAVHRAAHDAVGGFDTTMPPVEDADYCIRLRDAGYTLHVARDAVVRYRFRSRYSDLIKQAKSYGEGTVKLYSRHRQLPRPPYHGLRSWGSLLRHAFRVRDKATLGAFVWKLGNAIGFARGSIRHRYLMLGL